MENLEIIGQILYAISLIYQLIEKIVKSIYKSNKIKKKEEKAKTLKIDFIIIIFANLYNLCG